jgi:hypothetical protein
MRKTVAIVVAFSFLLAGCGRPQYLGDGAAQKYYPTYGLFNDVTSKSKNACYEISVGNVVWSIILIETIIAPVYFIGWSIYNPTRLKRGPDDQCAFDS